ncbi:hypothetical protein [Streptomyces chilikensis]|uniref:hypothetical protein n=1 Tax=Streptomyces chilikensis TaxID=1194079 RepID=UPI000A515FA5|nr:hypothetical protein [Streptomyces chilikensis]
MLELRGLGGRIVFDGECLTIARQGFLARMTVSMKENRLRFSHVSLQFERPEKADDETPTALDDKTTRS